MRKGALVALALIAIVAFTVARLSASSVPRATGTSRCSRSGATTGKKGSAVHTLLPPGNSSVSQYVENVPTAHGGCPSSGIGTGLTLHTGRSRTISPSAQAALLAAGPDGAATEALARATAPGAAGNSEAGVPIAGSSKTASQTGTRRSGTTDGSSPLQALGRALGGSSGGGGLGLLFPIVLALCLVGAAFVLLYRRRMN